MFMSAFATAIFVIPLFLGPSKADAEAKHKNTQQDMRHKIYIISGMEGRTQEERQALENIYAWIDLKTPGKITSPESSLGFNKFAGKPPKYTFTPSDATFQEPKKDDEATVQEVNSTPMILGEEKTILTKPINEIVPWKPFWEVVLPEIPKSEQPEGIIWRNAAGKRIANAPEIDEKIARESWNKKAPTGVTSLECSHFMGKMPPRVILRKSCGNTELDLLAVAALRRHLLNLESLSMGDGGSFKPFLAEVLWHLRN